MFVFCLVITLLPIDMCLRQIWTDSSRGLTLITLGVPVIERKKRDNYYVSKRTGTDFFLMHGNDVLVTYWHLKVSDVLVRLKICE